MAVQKVLMGKDKTPKWLAPHLAFNEQLGKQMDFYPVDANDQRIPFDEQYSEKKVQLERNAVVAEDGEIKDTPIVTDKEETDVTQDEIGRAHV